jgi:hypothetical protein
MDDQSEEVGVQKLLSHCKCSLTGTVVQDHDISGYDTKVIPMMKNHCWRKLEKFNLSAHVVNRSSYSEEIRVPLPVNSMSDKIMAQISGGLRSMKEEFIQML